jgi:hypothetical protein
MPDQMPDTNPPADRVAEIKARLDAAVAKPWRLESAEHFGTGGRKHLVKSWVGSLIAHAGHGPDGGSSYANGDLMAHAPTDLAYLLSRVGELEEQLAKARVLHKLDDEFGCGNADHTNRSVLCPDCVEVCKGCGDLWPCPDARALGIAGGVR